MSAMGLMVIPSISTIPEAYAAVDKFGVEMVYPPKTGGEQGLMKMDSPTSDSRLVPKTTLTKKTDGSWKVRSDAVRMNVFTYIYRLRSRQDYHIQPRIAGNKRVHAIIK
jgi:hypothetical protein